ncbi:helix-turn-helix transcriptional regulator [Anaerolineales bacterium HSG25]|nr:helix-turn-helix transcriptional regulator [Anaerolineales bacterium HSG25]
MNKLGEKLYFLRKKQGLTTKQLGDMLGVDRSLITKFETGKNIPSLGLAFKIAQFFEITVDDLVNDEIEID